MSNTDLLTPAEAAVVAGMTVRQVNKLIDEELPARAVRRRSGRRLVTTSGVACLKVSKDVSGLLTAKARFRVYFTIVEGKVNILQLNDSLRVDLDSVFRETERKVGDLHRIRGLVAVDPDILSGRPCFAGTRIPVAQIVELLEQGADTAEILEDYPALTAEMVEAAPVLAKAYPARGRPRARPWTNEGLLSETRAPRD